MMKNKAEHALILNFSTSSRDILLIGSVSLLPLHASPPRPPQTGTHESVTTSLGCSLELEIYPPMGEICVRAASVGTINVELFKGIALLFTCPLQDRQAGISGPLSLDFLCDRLTWEPVLALYNSIATCSLLLTLVNLILRSAAARKRFLLALQDAQIFCLGYEN